MGWDFEYCSGTPSKAYVKERMEDTFTWEKEDGTKLTILKSVIVGSAWYGALETVKPNGTITVTAVTAMLSIRHGEWGCKVMDETEGPYLYECPDSILNMLTPTDNAYAMEWRKTCRVYTKKKKRLKELPFGAIISIPWGDGDTMTLTKRHPRYQFKKAWWEAPNGSYVKKTDIPIMEYEVLFPTHYNDMTRCPNCGSVLKRSEVLGYRFYCDTCKQAFYPFEAEKE